MSEHEHEWDGTERRQNSGFQLNSWSAVLSFMSVCLMGVGGISWGLKLENRIDKCVESQQAMRDRLEDEILRMRTTLDRGILPITQVRLDGLEDQIQSMKEQLEGCMKKR